MTISAGEKMPAGTFGIMTDAGPGAVSTDELFAGKKVVLVSVPGAFTPTCSMNHLPGFVDQADQLTSKGVDTIACMAVNDVFVMDAWGKDRGVGDKVMMLADGNGEYARAEDLFTKALHASPRYFEEADKNRELARNRLLGNQEGSFLVREDAINPYCIGLGEEGC